jgi:hypothetical protein
MAAAVAAGGGLCLALSSSAAGSVLNSTITVAASTFAGNSASAAGGGLSVTVATAAVVGVSVQVRWIPRVPVAHFLCSCTLTFAVNGVLYCAEFGDGVHPASGARAADGLSAGHLPRLHNHSLTQAHTYTFCSSSPPPPPRALLCS